MSPDEFAKKMREKIESLRTKNLPLKLAVSTSVGDVSTRAFTNKLNEKGEFFRYNSLDPIYIRDEQSPRDLSRKGKYGSDTFKSGKKKGEKHKTTYFGSYKEFRASVDADSEAVDWQLTNELRSDYGNSPKSTKPEKLKPAVQVNVNNYITRLSRENNIKKYEGLVKRYGNFLTCSEKEIQDYFRILDLELGNFLAK